MNNTIKDCTFTNSITITISGDQYSLISEAASSVGEMVGDFVLNCALMEAALIIDDEDEED